jgi:hypothetical protein
MRIKLIRSATLRIEYAGKNFIVDPYLAEKYTMPSYTGKSPNPLVDLKCSPAEVIKDVEIAVISHLHSDHFDPVAKTLLPKKLPILCQPENESEIRAAGFSQVMSVHKRLVWSGITITRTLCEHGTGEVLKEMGNASGFVLQADNEPTIYWTGDTILCDAVLEAIHQFHPKIIVVHSCGAVWGNGIPIVMDVNQTLKLCQAASKSIIVATHMDSLDHALVTRDILRKYAKANGILQEQLLIPEDMEQYTFE